MSENKTETRPSKSEMKSRPQTTGLSSETDEEIVVERFLNKGLKVTLSDGSSLTLKEIPAWDMLDLAQPLLRWLVKWQKNEGDTVDIIAEIMIDKELRKSLFQIIAKFARTTDVDTFNNLLPRDLTALIKGIRKVVREEEIKSLFLAVGMQTEK
tara:strand:- start:31579 stop:32040 length:462 start_codon:yes stop_codon:yes gene_type:complete